MNDLLPLNMKNPAIYQQKVWGNTAEIQRFTGFVPEDATDPVGEVFLASAHPDGPSRFVDGRLFTETMAEDPTIFGASVNPKQKFPLLVKVLSAVEQLSVQTHYKNKVEAWVTLSDGEMLYGLTLKGEEMLRTPEGCEALYQTLLTATEVETLAQYFNHVHFTAGEAYIIQAGMVHALLRGTVYEPQKNSNLTVRGGDWGRNDPGRPLHKEAFFESVYPFTTPTDPIQKMYKKGRADETSTETSTHACLFATEDFAVDEIVLHDGERDIRTFDDRFFIATILEGDITVDNGTEQGQFSQGSAFVLCARENDWFFRGTGKILLTYVPDLEKSIITPLKENGYSYEDIIQIGGPIRKENDIYIAMKEYGMM